ncbi:MAG TPA: lipoyl synthase [Gammaproteobacteria bacterium]|nr:lipoyl synthase [Gammaproteobacteria bacterium]
MSIKEKIIPVFNHSTEANASRMPLWIRQQLGKGQTYSDTVQAVHGFGLHTVCEEAHCPNRGECWSQGTATFMLLGDTCTRACGFCAVKTGQPGSVDKDEPQRVAEAAVKMGLDYVVLTSVNRDELADGGAGIFADTIVALRRQIADVGLELLTPDFYRREAGALESIAAALATVKTQKRELQMVWGHNMETVPSLYKKVRKGSSYTRSLALLKKIACLAGVEAKSSLMLGLGESREEVLAVMRDLRDAGVLRISLGQYLRPSRYHLAVQEYVDPAEFDDYAQEARQLGFSWVKSGPMVRSSYHAHE